MCADAKLNSRSAPRGVEIISRVEGTPRWLFALNFANAETEIQMNESGVEVLQNIPVNGRLKLAARGVAIVSLTQT